MTVGVIIPIIVVICIALAGIKRVDMVEAFSEGAMRGIKTIVNLLPMLIMMISATQAMDASGLIKAVSALAAPLAAPLQIPIEVLPLAIIKPFSGAGSIAMLQNLLATYGADTFLGRAASSIMGSSDTAFYICAMYLSAAGVKNGRYAVPVALISSVAGTLAAIYFCRLF